LETALVIFTDQEKEGKRGPKAVQTEEISKSRAMAVKKTEAKVRMVFVTPITIIRRETRAATELRVAFAATITIAQGELKSTTTTKTTESGC